MTITAIDIIAGLWKLTNTPASETNGKTGSQKRAFKLLLELRGGLGFIASQPAAELEELARRGVCSANLGMVVREMASIGLLRRKVLLNLADLELQLRGLMLAARETTRREKGKRRSRFVAGAIR